MLLKILESLDSSLLPHDKNHLALNVSSAKVEKPRTKGRWHMQAVCPLKLHPWKCNKNFQL
jgi:hypothetical protein